MHFHNQKDILGKKNRKVDCVFFSFLYLFIFANFHYEHMFIDGCTANVKTNDMIFHN